MSRARRLVGVTVALGGGDLLTGLGLIAIPGSVLRSLGIDLALYPTELLGWLGAFVAGVGAATLYPLALGGAWRERLAVVLEATALIRYAVAAYLAASMLRGVLPTAWWSVALYDAAAATLQLAWLRPEALRGA